MVPLIPQQMITILDLLMNIISCLLTNYTVVAFNVMGYLGAPGFTYGTTTAATADCHVSEKLECTLS